MIAGLLAVGLEALLERGFEVAGEGTFLEGLLEIGQGGLDDLAADEGGGGGEAAVEIDGGDHGFEGVGEDGGLAAAAVAILTAAEAKEAAELEAACDAGEVIAADDGGAEAGEVAFLGGGELAQEGLGGGEAEDGITEEFELLVVDEAGGGRGFFGRNGLAVRGGLLGHVLSNSFGFGGTNAALVLKHVDA